MKISIDNQVIAVDDGATILDAARKAGIEIPTLCHLQGCQPCTSCLVCVVKVNSSSRYVPSCATKVVDGMVVESETEEIHAARRMALELLLGDHLGDCIAPCQSICPAHMDIPTMLRQIAAEQLREAIITVKAAIPLPATLGRICPNLCERGCRRAQQDSPVSICELKRFVADTDLASTSPFLPDRFPATGKRVAIIGAGPAGLSAAYYLQQAGHACMVFDDHPQAGGMLRYGVSKAQLPDEVLDAEIALIAKLGVEFRLGERASLDKLGHKYDAVLLATGEASANNPAITGIDTIDKRTHQTNLPDVFAAGSAVAPSKHAVHAVGDGHAAARAISQYLAGDAITGNERPFTVRIGQVQREELNTFMAHANPADRLSPATELTLDEAREEARRCLHCDCRKLTDCKLRQYAIAYNASATKFKGERRTFSRDCSHPEVIYEPGKCIDCGLCVQIASKSKESLGLTYIGRGFDIRMAVPFNETLADGLRQVADECVQACPTGALSRKDDCGE